MAIHFDQIRVGDELEPLAHAGRVTDETPSRAGGRARRWDRSA